MYGYGSGGPVGEFALLGMLVVGYVLYGGVIVIRVGPLEVILRRRQDR